jgi:hypothetical protein
LAASFISSRASAPASAVPNAGLSVGVEHPLDVAVQRPQHADPRMHQEVAT